MLVGSGDSSLLGQEGWLFEIKWTGCRALASVANGTVHLRSGAMNYTRAFAEVSKDLARLPGGPHILDGQIVLPSSGGRVAEALQARIQRGKPALGDPPAVFKVFDALVLGGASLSQQRLEVRKAALHQLLGDRLPCVQYVEHYPASASRCLFQQAVQLRLEGLVAKRCGSLYVPHTRSRDWQKIDVREDLALSSGESA